MQYSGLALLVTSCSCFPIYLAASFYCFDIHDWWGWIHRTSECHWTEKSAWGSRWVWCGGVVCQGTFNCSKIFRSWFLVFVSVHDPWVWRDTCSLGSIPFHPLSFMVCNQFSHRSQQDLLSSVLLDTTLRRCVLLGVVLLFCSFAEVDREKAGLA